MKIEVEPIKPVHSVKLRRLFKEAVRTDFSYFPSTYQMRILRQNTTPRLAIASLRSNRALFGATTAGQMTGFIIGNVPETHIGQIHWLYTSPDFRGQGIGHKLLGTMINHFRGLGCPKVVLVTHKYRDYYAKRGFSLEQVNREWFRGIDMHIMSLNLKARRVT